MSPAPPVVLLIGCLAAATPGTAHAASAITGAAEVVGGGGYDTNPLLTVPGQDPAAAPVGGWFARLAPVVVGGLTFGGGHRLSLGWEADLRAGDRFGRLALQELELSYATPRFGAARVRAAAHVGSFHVSASPADRFVDAGGELGLRLELGERWRLLVDAGLAARRYTDDPAGAHTSAVHVLTARVPFRPDPLIEVGLDGFALAVATGIGDLSGSSAFWRLRAGPYAQIVHGRLVTTAALWGADVDATGSPRPQLGGAVVVRWWAFKRLDLLASVQIDQGVGPDRRPIDDRRLVFAGASLHAAAARTLRSSEEQPDGGLAPLVEPGRVSFRVDAPDALRVTVMGSWDDWAREQPLTRRDRTGRWQGWVAVPAGAHRYRFRIDGHVTRPPAAPRYQRDDFGGEDGVVDVAP